MLRIVRGGTRAWREAGAGVPALVLGLAAAGVALAAAVGLSSDESASGGTAIPTASPPAALTVQAGASAPDGGAADRAVGTVTLGDGTTFGPGFSHETVVGAPGPWAGWDAARGVAAWPERLAPRVTLIVPGERFTEEAYVGATPAPCYAFHRTVTGVDVGIDGPVGAAIAGELLAWLEPPYFAGEVTSDDDPRCRDRPRGAYGFALEEVARIGCALPDGPELRCFVVAQWAWHLADTDVRRVALLVFDRATGVRLDGEALTPGRDVVTVNAEVSRRVCAAGGTCAPLTLAAGQVLPTLRGLVVEFAPGVAAEASHGTRRLVVAWSARDR